MRAALVVDHGDSRSALAAARGLARAGWRVAIGSPTPAGLAPASGCVARWIHVPAPEADIDAFVTAVDAAVRSHGARVVFPSDDQQMIALSRRRADIGAHIPYPAHDVVMRAVDKLELHRAALRAGVGSPETAEATPDALTAVRGPVVVKPRIHNPMERAGAPAHLPARVAADRREAEAAVATIRAAGAAPLLQEAVAGEQIAVSAVVDGRGRIVAALQQRALRLYPPGSGISARAVTVAAGAELLASCESLLAELGWLGLAQLQFRVPADGVPRLIDCNGRFYGSLALALHARVNLPDAWARVALGEPVDGRAPAPAGVRYQWLEGDVRAALADRRPLLELARALAVALRAGHSVWDPRDPRPGLRLAGRFPRRLLRTVRGAVARRSPAEPVARP
jgi:predicted ATP-grasp superfamily ATP-dependent carboligase